MDWVERRSCPLPQAMGSFKQSRRAGPAHTPPCLSSPPHSHWPTPAAQVLSSTGWRPGANPATPDSLYMATIHFLNWAKPCLLLDASNTISYVPLPNSSSLAREPLPFTARQKAGSSMGEEGGPALYPAAFPVNEQRGPGRRSPTRRPQTSFPLGTPQT